jgi:hypothetical protein
MRTPPRLPPVIAGFKVQGVDWQPLKHVDFPFLGYLLSCHLAIEHYLTNFLTTATPLKLGWEDARLRFTQKVALVEKLDCFPPPYDLLPSIKHLNTLRNRFAHKLDIKLTTEDLKPFADVVERIAPKRKTPNRPLKKALLPEPVHKTDGTAHQDGYQEQADNIPKHAI